MRREYKGIEIGTRCGWGSYRTVYTVKNKAFYHDYDGVGGYHYHEPFCYSRLKDAKYAIDVFLETGIANPYIVHPSVK